MKKEEIKELTETLQKQINALDNLLDNTTIQCSDEVILFRLRMEIFRQLKESKSTARNSVNN